MRNERLREELREFNLQYHATHNKWCAVIHEWVVLDELKCLMCDKDGDNPKCFRVGGRHNEQV